MSIRIFIEIVFVTKVVLLENMFKTIFMETSIGSSIEYMDRKYATLSYVTCPYNCICN